MSKHTIITNYLFVADQPNKKLLFNAGLIPGQIADVRADTQDGGNKINLFYANVKLDDANFLKSDHKVDSKAIEALIQRIRERSTTYFNGLEAISKEWAEEGKQETQKINELAKKAAPNLQPLKQYYARELEEVKQEILNDKSIKELGEAIRKVLGSLITAASEFFNKISQIAEASAESIQNSFNSVIASVEKELLPRLKEIGSKLLAATKNILETILNISLGVLAKAAQIIEQYQPELQEIATAFGELFQDVGRLIHRIYDNAYDSVRGLADRISAELKASPVLEELKAQYEQVSIYNYAKY